MAQLDGMQQNGGTSKTVEQLLHTDSPTTWNMPTTFGRVHDQEEDHCHQAAKKLSVIAKVKEKARKWRQSLGRKKHGHEYGNNTPSWGVALEDYEVDDDSSHLGPPIYESEHAPEGYKKITRQHSRADPMSSHEKRALGSSININSYNQERERFPHMKKTTTGPTLPKSYSDNQRGKPSIPKTTITETLRARSFGNYQNEQASSSSKTTTIEALMAERNAAHLKEKLPRPKMTAEIVSVEEIQEHPSENVIDKSTENEQKNKLLVPEKATTQNVIDESTRYEQKEKLHSPKKTTKTEGSGSNDPPEEEEEESPTTKKTITEFMSEKLGPAYATVSEATQKITSRIQGMSMPSFPVQGAGDQERKSDKGVSVKEYLKNKLEPGEDERALSQVISEVISPRRSPSDKGVVEKVKEAVTLLLQTESSSSAPSSIKSSDSASHIPVSTNAHEEVEEENKGRILQAN